MEFKEKCPHSLVIFRTLNSVQTPGLLKTLDFRVVWQGNHLKPLLKEMSKGQHADTICGHKNSQWVLDLKPLQVNFWAAPGLTVGFCLGFTDTRISPLLFCVWTKACCQFWHPADGCAAAQVSKCLLIWWLLYLLFCVGFSMAGSLFWDSDRCVSVSV